MGGSAVAEGGCAGPRREAKSCPHPCKRGESVAAHLGWAVVRWLVLFLLYSGVSQVLVTACHAVMFKNDCAEEVVQLGDARRWGPAPQPSAAAPCRAVAGVRDKLCRRREVRQEELLVAGSADELSLQIPDAYKQRFHARSESSVRLEGRSSRGDSGIPWVLRVSEGHVACNPAGIALVKQNRAAQTLVSWVAQDRLCKFSLGSAKRVSAESNGTQAAPGRAGSVPAE